MGPIVSLNGRLRETRSDSGKGRQENRQHKGNDLRDPEERAARQPATDCGDLSSQVDGSRIEAHTREPAWLSVGQLCRRWQLDRNTVYKFIDAKILPT
jgi:hypothetical protein